MVAAGYANDSASLRSDPAFKMAVDRLPESGAALCSQPTISRLENAPSPAALKRMMAAMIDLFCGSFAETPRRIVLDIDVTCHLGLERRQMSGGYASSCFLLLICGKSCRTQAENPLIILSEFPRTALFFS